MEKDYLVLKRASASRLSGEWNDDDFDVLCDGIVVGRIMKAAAVPVGCRGCGRWPLAIMRIARQRTDTSRRARPRWQHSRRAGGGSSAVEADDRGESNQHPASLNVKTARSRRGIVPLRTSHGRGV